MTTALGLQKEQVLGRLCVNLIHPEDRQLFMRGGAFGVGPDVGSSVSFRMMHARG